MKIAFITELPFEGKIPSMYPDMRTEFAWMCALDAKHYNFNQLQTVNGYDVVFVIIPKGRVFLSAEGSQLVDGKNPISDLLRFDFVNVLKQKNKKVCFIQEGGTTWMSDASVADQFNWLNRLSEFDMIFAHNESDEKFYRGLLPGKKVCHIPSLMIEDTIKDVKWSPQNKVIIGGNFSRFYGGFYSYVIAHEFEGCAFHTMESHSKREGECDAPNLSHIPRVNWTDWIRELSTFKYAIHLMSTVAAGTFSLNCAYLGLPCIGNEKMDTQRILFPDLSVDVEDLAKARKLANLLFNDVDFYKEVSEKAKYNYNKNFYIDVWLKHMFDSISK